MKFLLLLTQVDGAWEKAPPGEGERVYAQYMELEKELKAKGKFGSSVRLRPAAEAGTIHNLPGGKRTVTPGPCFAGPEAIGGFYILQCDSMDEAIAWAQRMPNYGHGAIEVRSAWE